MKVIDRWKERREKARWFPGLPCTKHERTERRILSIGIVLFYIATIASVVMGNYVMAGYSLFVSTLLLLMGYHSLVKIASRHYKDALDKPDTV